jgi:hypothetical protein
VKVNAASPQPAVAPSTTNTAATAGAEPAIMPDPNRPMMRDGFDPTISFRPPVKPPVERPTLGPRDRQTASKLTKALESPFNRMRVDLGKSNQVLKYDQKSGVWRSPQGQPLVNVQLKNGITAYVDPSSNRYYLAKEGKASIPFIGGPRLNAHGPLSLPQGTRFSGDQFSVADAKMLSNIANGRRPPLPDDWIGIPELLGGE